MGENSKLKLHFELDNLKVDLEGDPETVSREFLTQLADIYPSFNIARKLSFNPDLMKISEGLVGLVEFVPEGIILNRRDLSAEQAILICLLGVHISYEMGRWAADSMSAAALSKITGKALKTISNQVALMVEETLVEKIGKGEYRITTLGIKRADAIAGGLK
ncbi:hypothetical protein MUP59_00710 [Candidatus Bathyarchaeota archaeon]|nr:hypothetical protein [Candidatus Bathyarchaeota archaeon]